MREKINIVTGGEGLTRNVFDPRTSRIYFTHLHELPDSVKNYPEPCQRCYLVTYNNNLRRWKSVPIAMKAAWNALTQRHEKWLYDQRESRRSRPSSDDIAREIIDKAKPLRPQIVVA
jgi:hypothetical protein